MALVHALYVAPECTTPVARKPRLELGSRRRRPRKWMPAGLDKRAEQGGRSQVGAGESFTDEVLARLEMAIEFVQQRVEPPLRRADARRRELIEAGDPACDYRSHHADRETRVPVEARRPQ